MGVVSLELLSKFPNSNFYFIEGNDSLVKLLEKNIQSNYTNCRCSIINAIIGESDSNGYFQKTNNSLSSKLLSVTGEQLSVAVDHVTKFSSLHNDLHINEEYSLICDIEGAEYFIFSDQDSISCLSNCAEILIELHPIQINNLIITISDLIEIIVAKGFSLVDTSARAHYFLRV